MAESQADRNLLFGILALQLDFISRDALIAAMHAWVLEKSKPLDQILIEQGALTRDRRSLLSALVQEHLILHRDDPEQSLIALDPLGQVQQALREIDDPDVQASLLKITQVPLPFSDQPTLPAPTSDGGYVGRFRTLHLHATGGLGEVLVAEDRELHREVALKRIQARHAHNPDSCSRFLLEAEITGGLEHPGVVPVYGLGTSEDGRPCYAMRFIRGETLRDAISGFHSSTAATESEHRLALRQLLGRLIAVCNAIEFAHSRGVIHRDIKPSNIMLGKYGETIVVDWGLAKALGKRGEHSNPEEHTYVPSSGGSSETLPGSAIGTPAYMSPEQAEGRVDEIGMASDVYSLGATLYILLTGKEPFEPATVGVMLAKVQKGEFSPPRELSRQVPPALNAICLKAMALKPSDRYLTAKALADDLERYLADEPIAASPEPAIARLQRWPRKHPRAFTSIAATLVLGLLGAIIIATIVADRNQKLLTTNDSQRKSAYRTNLTLMQVALEGRDFRAAETALGDCDSELRGWEYDHVRARFNQFIPRILRPTSGGEIQAIALHPQRELVAVGTRRGWIDFLEINSGKSLGSLSIPPDERSRRGFVVAIPSVHCLRFSPDGTLLAAADKSSGSTFVWNWETRELIYRRDGDNTLTLTFGPQLSSLSFSSDGKHLADGVGKELRLVETGSWKELWQHDRSNALAEFSHAGDKLMVAGDFGDLQVFNVLDGSEDRTISGMGGWVIVATDEADAKRQREYGHNEAITGILPLDDGKTIATSSDDGTVRLWNLSDGERVGLIHLGGDVACGLSQCGQDIITVSKNGVLHAMRAGDARPYRTSYYRDFSAVEVEPRNQSLVTASKEAVIVWDANALQDVPNENWQLTANLHDRRVVCISPNGRLAAFIEEGKGATEERGFVLVDLQTRNRIFRIPDRFVFGLQFSPDSQRLVAIGSHIRCYAVTDGKMVLQSDEIIHPDVEYGERPGKDGKTEKFVRSWSFSHSSSEPEVANWSPQHRMLVCDGNSLQFWNDAGDQVRTIVVEEQHRGGASAYNLATGESTRTKPGKYKLVLGGVFLPAEGNIVITQDADHFIHAWGVIDGREEFKKKVEGVLRHVLPEGTMLIENAAKEWELWSSKLERKFGALSHDGGIRCACSITVPDRVVTGGEDGCLRIWDAMSTQPLLVLNHGRRPVIAVGLSVDDRTLFGIDDTGLVRSWRAELPEEH